MPVKPLKSTLAEAEIAALMHACHADPFSKLGMHLDANQRLIVRVLLPQAEHIEVVDAASGKTIAALARVHPDGLFEALMARRRKRFDYRLKVRWRGGDEGVYADAYSHGSTIAADDLHYLGEGTHLRPWTVMGAHPLTLAGVKGVRFAVWAPNASSVSVVGNFNTWDVRRHGMRVHHGVGIWEIFVPHAQAGDQYKYALRDAAGNDLPLKADPYAFAAELRPANASIVAAPRVPAGLPAARRDANQRDAAVSIYEVHLGSWRRAADGGFLDWDALAASLPAYAADLGFTHLELLPVSEHPFDGSWGYQTLGQFAPSARYGTPDGFARFVSACHTAGLGVILDWVPAHFPQDAFGLANFDGTALYEYADPREGFHRDWNTAIYNFGRTEVRNFLAGSALYWLEQFGLDGLRVDAVASMLYRDYSRPAGEWLPNVHGGRENLEAISLIQRISNIVGEHTPGAVLMAEESTAFPGVSRPVHDGGLGFHYKWNMGWMHDTLSYIQREPLHRKWHHEQITFGLVCAFSENFVLPLSHDEVVHGKGSLINKMPGEDWQQFANLRAYFGFMWGHPGKKLLFMGGEFAQRQEWNHDQALQWKLLDAPAHTGVSALIRDLNNLYRSRPALHLQDCEAEGFEWVTMHDADQSVYAFLRKAGAARVLVICNFTPVPRHDYTLTLASGAALQWREVLNTDSGQYGGSNAGNGTGPLNSHSLGDKIQLQLMLPPLATLFLEPV